MNKDKNNSKRVEDITDLLLSYKQAKQGLENRLENERTLWRQKYSDGGSASSWTFNSIVSKHADVIDNMPQCTCLPREECDSADAELLSQVIPIITDRCNFDEIYSKNA